MTGRTDAGEQVGVLSRGLTACVYLLQKWGIALSAEWSSRLASPFAASNETSMVVLLFLLSLFVLGRAVIDRRVDGWALLLLGVAGLAAAAVVAAPGNGVRMAYESARHHRQPVLSAAVHSLVALRQTPVWAESLEKPLFGLLLVPAAAALSRRRDPYSRIFHVHPLVLTSILFALMVVCYFPTYWSLEHDPAPRTLNVAYLLFLVGFFVAIVSAIRYLPGGSRDADTSSRARIPIELPGYAIPFVAFCIAVSLKSEGGNARRGWADLISGRAYGFDVETRDRYGKKAVRLKAER